VFDDTYTEAEKCSKAFWFANSKTKKNLGTERNTPRKREYK
jgi:ribosomal protein L24E